MASDYEIRYRGMRRALQTDVPENPLVSYPMSVPELTQRGRSFVVYSPQFRRWFGKSKVVDHRRRPMVVYHGSKNPKFTTFRYDTTFEIGPHFGTYRAAEQFTDPLFGDKDERRRQQRTHIRPFYLSIQNPLRIYNDPGYKWNDGLGNDYAKEPQPPTVESLRAKSDSEFIYAMGIGVLRQLLDQKILSPDAVRAIAIQFLRDYPLRAEHYGSDLAKRFQARGPYMNAVLRRLGYDGIVYKNLFEDAGSESWVVLDPRQVKSAYNVGGFDPENPDVLAGLYYSRQR